MPSLARSRPRQARQRALCVCGHTEDVHRVPLDAFTGQPIEGQNRKLCRSRVADVRIKGRARICVTSPCPCPGYASKGEFAEV